MKKIVIVFLIIMLLSGIGFFYVSNDDIKQINVVNAANEIMSVDYDNLQVGTILLDNGNVTINKNGYTQNNKFTEYNGEYTIVQQAEVLEDKGIIVEDGEQVINIRNLNIKSGNPIIQLLGQDLVTIKIHDENIFNQLNGYYIKDLQTNEVKRYLKTEFDEAHIDLENDKTKELVSYVQDGGGIYVPEGAKLKLQEWGTLRITTQTDACIGGSNIGNKNNGTVTIDGGVIFLNSTQSAGIGGATGWQTDGGNGGTVTVNNVYMELVTNLGAGIGGGFGNGANGGQGANFTMNGGNIVSKQSWSDDIKFDGEGNVNVDELIKNVADTTTNTASPIIGGGAGSINGGDNLTTTINDGTLEMWTRLAPSIGGGVSLGSKKAGSGGTVVIGKEDKSTNPKVVAGSLGSAAIGGTYGSSKGLGSGVNFKMYSGTVEVGAAIGAGIGSGSNSTEDTTIEIYGGNIKSAYGSSIIGAGIGSGNGSDIDEIIIENATIESYSGNGAAIGSGKDGNVGRISIKKSNIIAKTEFITVNETDMRGAGTGAGIGAGSGGTINSILIEDSTIDANARTAAGIGSAPGYFSADTSMEEIIILNSHITVNSGVSAGIGSAHGQNIKNIQIDGSELNLYHYEGAGIGSGQSGTIGTILINDTTVNLYPYRETNTESDGAKSIGGAGIGTGQWGKTYENASIVINDSQITENYNNLSGIVGFGQTSTGSLDKIELNNTSILEGTQPLSSNNPGGGVIGGGTPGDRQTTIKDIIIKGDDYEIQGQSRVYNLIGFTGVENVTIENGRYRLCGLANNSGIEASNNITIKNAVFTDTQHRSQAFIKSNGKVNLENTQFIEKNYEQQLEDFNLNTGSSMKLHQYFISKSSSLIEGTDITISGANTQIIETSSICPIIKGTNVDITGGTYSLDNLYSGSGIIATGTINIQDSNIETTSCSYGVGFGNSNNMDSINISNSTIKSLTEQQIQEKYPWYEGDIVAQSNIFIGSKQNINEINIENSTIEGYSKFGTVIGAFKEINTIDISGSTINANKGKGILEDEPDFTDIIITGAAIGSAPGGSVGSITINGSTIIAESMMGAAIGSGQNGSIESIKINNSNITGKSWLGAVIGSGGGSSVTSGITIENSTIDARTLYGAAIGSGQQNNDGTVTVGNIILNDNIIYAQSKGGSGIGGGSGFINEEEEDSTNGVSATSITIDGGIVTAVNLGSGAAIGGGYGLKGGDLGTLTIKSGTVRTSANEGANNIGRGYGPKNSDDNAGDNIIIIDGGSIPTTDIYTTPINSKGEKLHQEIIQTKYSEEAEVYYMNRDGIIWKATTEADGKLYPWVPEGEKANLIDVNNPEIIPNGDTATIEQNKKDEQLKEYITLYYKIDDVNLDWTEYTAILQIPEGKHTIYAKAILRVEDIELESDIVQKEMIVMQIHDPIIEIDENIATIKQGAEEPKEYVTLYYKIDDSEEWTEYNGEIILTVGEHTVYAQAVAQIDEERLESNIVSKTVTIEEEPKKEIVVKDPEIRQEGKTAIIEDTNTEYEGVILEYRLNGSEWREYKEPITLPTGENIIEARAKYEENSETYYSNIVQKTITITDNTNIQEKPIDNNITNERWPQTGQQNSVIIAIGISIISIIVALVFNIKYRYIK